jgi:hypothetical protein
MRQQPTRWEPRRNREPIAQPEPFAEPVAENSEWPDESTPAKSSPHRAKEARAQVLAFINRLEDLREAEAAAERTPRRGFETPMDDSARMASRRPGFDASSGISTNLEQRVREPERSRPPQKEAAPPKRTAMAPATIEPPAQASAQPPRVVSVAIRQRGSFDDTEPKTAAQVEAARQSEGQVANRPIATEQAGTEIDALKLAIEKAEQRAEESPGDLDALWQLVFLRLSAGEDVEELELPADMPDKETALFHRTLATIRAARVAMEDPVSGIDEALAATESLRRALKPQAELRVPTVALCSRVNAFGVFEELPEGAMREGVHNQAIVYFEIENFASQKTDDGRYRSVIRDRFEVMSPDGELLWEHEEPNIEDISRSRREDFFVAQRITLPPTLEGGECVLKVTVEDLLADKRTQAIHEFTIDGPRRTASK